MVFSPNAFRGAPHTDIATLTFPGGGTPRSERKRRRCSRRRPTQFPTVTAVRVRDVLDAVGDLVANLVLAIRGASALTLLVAVLVLGGALAAGHRHRVYDAVILKTARRHAAAAAFRLCARISAARRRHRGVWRGGRLGGCRFCHHQGHEPVVRLPAGAAAARRRRARLRRPSRSDWSAPSPRSARSPRPCCATSERIRSSNRCQ